MSHGSFVWHDLATTDVAGAKAFYQSVVGWSAEDVPALHYTMLKMGDVPAGGMMELPEHLRALRVPPHWSGYIGVDDVDAGAERLKAAGGELKRPPEDIPGVGRFAVVADPAGAVFYLFKGSSDAVPDVPPMAKGHVGWHELHTSDPAGALRFYTSLFGWSPSTAMDMGPMGTYQIFAYGGHDQGGMMRAQDGMHSAWLMYFVVDGIDAALGRVQGGGGTIMHGPQEVPGGAWVIQCRDPQGAAFALVSGKR